VRRHFEIDTRTRGPRAAVLDEMPEALLTRVEIDFRDALTGFQQRDGDMQRYR
jgi:hypothetical protein